MFDVHSLSSGLLDVVIVSLSQHTQAFNHAMYAMAFNADTFQRRYITTYIIQIVKSVLTPAVNGTNSVWMPTHLFYGYFISYAMQFELVLFFLTAHMVECVRILCLWVVCACVLYWRHIIYQMCIEKANENESLITIVDDVPTKYITHWMIVMLTMPLCRRYVFFLELDKVYKIYRLY